MSESKTPQNDKSKKSRSFGSFAAFLFLLVALLLVLGGNSIMRTREELSQDAYEWKLYTGQIDTIWPMFGVANQLLGCIALAVATTILFAQGKARYTWVTIVPFLFLATNTLYGGFLNIRDNFYPKALSAVPAVSSQGWVLTICTAIMMVLAIIVLVSAFARWASLVSSGGEPVPAES